RGSKNHPRRSELLSAILGPEFGCECCGAVRIVHFFSPERKIQLSGRHGAFMANHRSTRIFYGWWIVVAAFLNLFFAVGIIFYGFPVFYPAFVESLGFLRAQVTQGFLLGFLVAGLPFGLLAGAVFDRIGARAVILPGAGLTGISLLLLGSMTQLWHYALLC